MEASLGGDRGALARLVSLIENADPDAESVLHRLFSRMGKAFRVGVTGPPGAGKSTLAARLARSFRSDGCRVGVVAVDPSSPFSHGALLGDRIRFSDLASDPGLYVRSMATRGSLGGLSRTTREVCDLLDAHGMERIVIETVGVGQSELDIVGAADSVVVVLVPESGDEIQTMKAGLIEIADLFVVNKADRPGADRMVQHLRETIESHPARDGWTPPVIPTVAPDGKGIEEVARALEEHRVHQSAEGGWSAKRRAGFKSEVEARIVGIVGRRFLAQSEVVRRIDEGIARVLRREESPYQLARSVAEWIAAQPSDANRRSQGS